MPDRMKKSERRRLTSSLRVDGSFFCCSYTAASVVPGSLIRKVSTWTCPCAEDQRVPFLALRLVRHLLGRKSEVRAGDGIVDHAPADLGLLSFRRCGEQSALLRIEDAGFLELAIALERLDGGRGLVVELAVDQAVVIAGPGEIELDRHAVRQGQGGIARWSRRRWDTFSRRRSRGTGTFPCRRLGRRGRRMCTLDGGTAAQGAGPSGWVARLAGLRGRWRRSACWRNGAIVLGAGRQRGVEKNENGTCGPHQSFCPARFSRRKSSRTPNFRQCMGSSAQWSPHVRPDIAKPSQFRE